MDVDKVTNPASWMSMDSVMGSTDDTGKFNMGWGPAAVQAASGAVNAYMGIQQFGLAKKGFKENVRQFDLNYGAQQQAYNSNVKGRAIEMAAASTNGAPAGYGSVDEYVQANRIA
jgi:hypothetical protein